MIQTQKKNLKKIDKVWVVQNLNKWQKYCIIRE